MSADKHCKYFLIVVTLFITDVLSQLDIDIEI